MSTNYENIVNMDIDRMSEFLSEQLDCGCCPAGNKCGEKGERCKDACKEWLQEEGE